MLIVNPVAAKLYAPPVDEAVWTGVLEIPAAE